MMGNLPAVKTVNSDYTAPLRTAAIVLIVLIAGLGGWMAAVPLAALAGDVIAAGQIVVRGSISTAA
jgi:hypothetical protein